MFGGIYTLVIINLLQNVDATLDGYIALLPLILLSLTLLNFWGESFISPTINYLLALGFGILIGVLALLGFHHLFLLYDLNALSSYMELVPVLISILCGIFAGKILFKVLKPRHPHWNTLLWTQKKLWDVINHNFYLLIVAIIAAIEGMFQMLSTSLIILLSSL